MITAEDKQAAEQQVLEDAQRRLEEKRASTRIEITPLKETVEARLARLGEKMRANPLKPSESLPDTVVQDLREKAGIPPRHRIEIPDGATGWHEKRAALVSKLGNGFLVALTGVQGTGKTQCGSALIYAATAKRMSCKYAVAMDFFIALKSTFDDGARQSEAQAIASFVKPKLLVLDEMDERSESAWENRLLFHMINARYNNLVDTLLISRKPEAEFLQSLGDSVTSRIQETGGSIICDWKSFRENS